MTNANEPNKPNEAKIVRSISTTDNVMTMDPPDFGSDGLTLRNVGTLTVGQLYLMVN